MTRRPRPHIITFVCDTPSFWLELPGGLTCTCNKKDTK